MAYGIRGVALKMIEYLKHRKQCVTFKNKTSREMFFRENDIDVLLGSVFSPLLFIIYINVLLGNVDSSETYIYIYADDSTFYAEHEFDSDLRNILSTTIKLYPLKRIIPGP